MENKATQQALQAGANPLVLALAQKMLGKKEYIGYCQSFVEKVTGSGWKGSSAINAWNSAPNRVQGTQGLQAGDLVYFSPNQSNQGYGHTGIYSGNGRFISATNSGVQESNLGDWINSTGQKLLGYLPQGDRISQQQQQSSQQPQQAQQVRRRLSYAPYNPVPIQQTPVPRAPIMPSVVQPTSSSQIGKISIPNIL